MQFLLTEEARAQTSLITSNDMQEFTRMLFGLMNAPFHFSKLMQRILGPFIKYNISFYLDDIMNTGKDWPFLPDRFIALIEA